MEPGVQSCERTLELVSDIRRDYGIESMAHLTCVGASREEIGAVLGRLAAEWARPRSLKIYNKINKEK